MIFIDGYNASGKSTFRALLDGMQGIFVVPVQDALISAFAREKNLEYIMVNRDLIGLRRVLVTLSNYYMIEHYADVGRLNLHASLDDIFYTDFKFDFPAHEQECFRQIKNLPAWTPANIINILYTTMPLYWRNYHASVDTIKQIAIWDWHHQIAPKYFLDTFAEGKVISIRRPVEDILATKYKRKVFAENFRSKYREKIKLLDAVKNNEASKVCGRHEFLEGLRVMHPERVLIIDFNALIENTEPIMREVCAFIGVPFSSVATQVCMNGHYLGDKNNRLFLGRVNDRADTVLSREEKLLIDLEMKKRNLMATAISHPGSFAKWARAKLLGLFSKKSGGVRAILRNAFGRRSKKSLSSLN